MDVIYNILISLISSDNFIAEVIGFVGFMLLMISNQAKERTQILQYSTFAAFAFIAHFSLLMAWTGATMHLIVILRNYIFSRKEKSEWAKNGNLLYFFILISIAVMIVTWDGYISILPAAGAIVFTTGMWLSKPLHMRFMILISVLLLWLPYTLIVGSNAGSLTQLGIAAAALYGMHRHDNLKKEMLPKRKVPTNPSQQ